MTVTRFAVDLGTLPVVLDLGGTFVFALSGAAAGVKHRLDVSASWCCPSWQGARAGPYATC